MKYTLGKVFLYLSLPLMIILLILDFDFENLTETVLFAVALVGLVSLQRLSIPILTVGWSIFTIGITLDFVDQFIKMPDTVELYLGEPAMIIGLALMVYGFHKLAQNQHL
ncbi:hypothetical protein [Desulforamulus ferrireducens]|uniref:Uncharacterized protein n=1 Tax=Desulforamulus ferrireducens TaxID=1833852 RepID=A0A1S6IZ10_9FIRM|nr:hypothetical protein [Desulforamulus ferrireducens]AQS60003.1 hypothetical protein B0537_13525 [Desulforamulus ferrireducens]